MVPAARALALRPTCASGRCAERSRSRLLASAGVGARLRQRRGQPRHRVPPSRAKRPGEWPCSRPSPRRPSPTGGRHAESTAEPQAPAGTLVALTWPLMRSLPAARRTVIEANAGGASWSETWRSRELLRVMVWRDFTLRYKQTFVGAGWAVLQPLGLTAVFALFFGRLVPLPVQGLPYAVFMLPAMVLWQFFSKSLLARRGEPVDELRHGDEGLLPADLPAARDDRRWPRRPGASRSLLLRSSCSSTSAARRRRSSSRRCSSLLAVARRVRLRRVVRRLRCPLSRSAPRAAVRAAALVLHHAGRLLVGDHPLPVPVGVPPEPDGGRGRRVPMGAARRRARPCDGRPRALGARRRRGDGQRRLLLPARRRCASSTSCRCSRGRRRHHDRRPGEALPSEGGRPRRGIRDVVGDEPPRTQARREPGEHGAVLGACATSTSR